MDHPNRKHPQHGVLWIEGQPTVVFDTICTQGRVAALANPLVLAVLCDIWRSACAWRVGRFVVMPDHLHYFAWATESPIPLDRWVTYWKSQVSKRLATKAFRWQSDHWDVRVRNAADYEDRWNYVRHNPVRAELVAAADDWPYQGEVHSLLWE